MQIEIKVNGIKCDKGSLKYFKSRELAKEQIKRKLFTLWNKRKVSVFGLSKGQLTPTQQEIYFPSSAMRRTTFAPNQTERRI